MGRVDFIELNNIDSKIANFSDKPQQIIKGGYMLPKGNEIGMAQTMAQALKAALEERVILTLVNSFVSHERPIGIVKMVNEEIVLIELHLEGKPHKLIEKNIPNQKEIRVTSVININHIVSVEILIKPDDK